MSEFKFVNPYNFIPLGENRAKAPAHISKYEDDVYTGVIKYSVLTKTPLFIPNTSNSDTYNMMKDHPGHKSYDFFTYTDLTGKNEPAKDAMPVIPGSEMRGMIRSNFEILTNSCMSAIDDDAVLSKRTSETFKAGLIYRKFDEIKKTYSFDLYKAKIDNCFMNKNNKLYEGCAVDFNGNSADTKNVSPSQKKKPDGYILKGEKGQKKKWWHIFSLSEENSGPLRKNISLNTLDKVLNEYEKNANKLKEENNEGASNKKTPYKEYSEQYQKFKNGHTNEKYFPVYYSYIDELKYLMLSPASITREIYGNKIENKIGDYHSCSNINNLCPACALFGMVATNKKEDVVSITSKIRFSDLVCQEPNAKACYKNKITLPPLSSPKLNNMEFYLKRPQNAIFWTYDYYIENGKIKKNNEGINGRKFYWHNFKYYNGEEKYKADRLNITVHPVREGITFSGKLYFRNLSKKELDQLIFTLKAGNDDEDNVELNKKSHGYKLGGAKPMGYGSIALSVDEVLLKKIDIEDNHIERKEILYYPDTLKEKSDIENVDFYKSPKEDIDNNLLKNFSKMTSFNAVEGYNVSYPFTDKMDKNDEHKLNYSWFVDNHKGGMGKPRTKMNYVEYLDAMSPETKQTKKGVEIKSSKNSRETGKNQNTKYKQGRRKP